MPARRPALDRPLRLWPGVLAAAVIVLLRYVAPVALPAAAAYGVLGVLAGGLVILLWWLLFSRAPWPERLGAVALMALAVVAVRPFLHPSIDTGMMGMMFLIYAVPATLSLTFVFWAVATRNASTPVRRATMPVAILLGCGVWLLARTDGILGEGVAQLAWRWTPTAEQRLLTQEQLPPAAHFVATADAAIPPQGSLSSDASIKRAEGPVPSEPRVKRAEGPVPSERKIPRVEGWTGFRGTERDGVVAGLRIATDWDASPPVQVWRRPVGPGWSSFAVSGDLIYTQEQRGDDEVIAAYRLTTGDPVWAYRDSVRFWESNGGAGPRGTPTLAGGRIYALGATGILNVLDARTGARAWSRDVAADTENSVPTWGFASSPLVVDDLVIVAAAGRLAAYEIATGRPRWHGPNDGGGYSSPHLATIASTRQVIFLSAAGAVGFEPGSGTLLWRHEWKGTPIVQPALVGDDVLIASGDMMGGMGLRRLSIRPPDPASNPAGWTVEERWTSRGLKPYFNDFVVFEGHAYGFDGSILSCISLADGERKWKGGRYGQGQFVLLPDSGLLLVLAEDGDLALVKAAPDKHTELARIPAIEGKTWNHPVVVGDLLLVRNGQEMAAFRLSLARR